MKAAMREVAVGLIVYLLPGVVGLVFLWGLG